LIFHPKTFALNNDGLRMMEQPVQDGGRQGAVIVKDFGPLLKGAVGGNDDCPLFIAQRGGVLDHLEEQIGTGLINGQVAQLVEDEERGFGVFLQFRFEPADPLGRRQGVDDINGTGKEHRVALEARGLA
jgi:hypothetical protein